MATKTVQPVDINQYQRLVGALSSRLQSSPTAYAPNTAPTASDLRTQLDLLTAKNTLTAEQQNRLKAAIYGASSGQKTTDLENPLPPKESAIVKGLHVLQMPGQVILGGVETVLGKGDGLATNIKTAVQTHKTYGDVLRESGLNNKWVDLPLGFALDVALDPVNWFTAGTDALVPKLYTGLKEGGIEGGLAAVKASGLQKAATATRYTPFVPSAIKETLASKAGAAEDIFRKTAGKASVLEEALAKSQKTKLGEKILSGASETGTLRQRMADKFNKFFKYSPGDWFKETKKLDEQTAQEFASGARGTLDDLLNELHGRAIIGPGTDLSNQLVDLSRGSQFMDYKNAAVRAAYNPPARGILEGTNSLKVQNELSATSKELQSVGDEITSQIKKGLDDTGIAWYDNLVKKTNANPYAKKVWDAIQFAHGMFKVAKVPFNFLTSYTNAAVSNLVMAGMGGINFTEPRYLATLKDALAIARGKAIGGNLGERLTPEVMAFLDKYRKLAGEGLGLDRAMLEKAINAKFLGELAAEARDLGAATKQGLAGGRTAEEIAKTLGESAPRTLEDMKSFISEEIFFGSFGKTMKDWQKNPEGVRKFIADRIEGASKAYNTIDQTYKIGTFLHLSTNGITGPELSRVANFVKLAPGDVEKLGNFYKFKPEKAAEVANELFMNYAAMPAAIRVLRNIPLLGSPFASFSYGMLTKTGKTLINNPAFFNKATFAREEISRAEPASPLEKAGLAGPYYNYLNRYERVKLPFFQDYPMYLNISNWLPYLSLNIFQESERQYTSPTAENVGNILDQLPFLKTPEGQLLYDYVIQPLVLNEAHPTGLFGQPIYYAGDTGLQRLGRIGQGVAETYTPSWLPPFGFRFRQLYNATQGKTAQGVESQTPGSELFLKGLSGMAGLPIANVNLQNVTYDIKKQVAPSTKKGK